MSEISSLLDIRDVSKAYGGVRAVRECSLTVEEGAIDGLIGPNGSGKTTLFNLVTGYDKPDSGRIHFAGVDITGSRPDRIFELGLGRTFQLTRIFRRLTLLENMLAAAQPEHGWFRSMVRSAADRRHRERANELLDFVGLTALSQDPAGTLSYGQQRLLEFAYILMADPKVVLLDEPTSGVNLTVIQRLAERIRDCNKAGTTFLIVEHNMEFVMSLCRRITVMQQGKPIATGSPEEVRTNPKVLDAYLGGGADEVVSAQGV